MRKSRSISKFTPPLNKRRKLPRITSSTQGLPQSGSFAVRRFDGPVEPYLTAKLLWLGDGEGLFHLVSVVRWTAVPENASHTWYTWVLQYRVLPNVDVWSPYPLYRQVAEMAITQDWDMQILQQMRNIPFTSWEEFRFLGWRNHPQLQAAINQCKILAIMEQKSRYA